MGVTTKTTGVDDGEAAERGRNVDGSRGVPLSTVVGRAPAPHRRSFLPDLSDLFSVHALFFAAYRDLVGVGSLSVELPSGATVADLVGELRGRGAPFDALPAEPAVAVNRTYAFPHEVLSSDDEVAFIPPVAGG